MSICFAMNINSCNINKCSNVSVVSLLERIVNSDWPSNHNYKEKSYDCSCLEVSLSSSSSGLVALYARLSFLVMTTL